MNAIVQPRASKVARAVSLYNDGGTPSESPQEIAEQIRKLMHDFQQKNDQRLKQLEQGAEDACTRDEVEKMNTEISELKAKLETATAQVGRLRVGSQQGPSGDLNAERQHAARFFSRAQRRRVRPDDVDVEAYRAYHNAFEQLIRSNFNVDHLDGELRNALRVGSDPDGGYLAPDEIDSEMERRIHDTSDMRPICRVRRISGPAWEAPYKSEKGTSGGWVGEQQARTSTATAQVGMQRIETHEQYAYPEVTQSMLDDGAIDVGDFVVEDTEMEMVRTENTAFVSGNGVMKPRGFLDYKGDAVTTDDATRAWGKLQYTFTGASAGFPAASGIAGASDPDALITIIQKLHPTYRAGARWAMNRATEATIRKLKDGDGRYLVGFGDIRDAASGFSLFGFPITNLEDLPDIAGDSFSVAFGNFQGYMIIDRVGFRVLRDPYTNKPYVGFYITKRVGGDVRNFDMIKLLKFGTS